MASVLSRRRRRMSLPCGRRGVWLHCGHIPRSSMRLRHCKGRGRCASQETGEVQFHDRSAICTAALAVYLGYPLSDMLWRALQRIATETIYQRPVFFIQHLGFLTPTAARRISLEEALQFERVHEETYRN